MLDGPILLQEIEIAICQLKKEKCPSLDGFPIEFYQRFQPELKHLLHSVYMKNIAIGEMHKTARQGLISLLEKPNCDQLLVKNWRPLTLLGSDYKNFSKILANRLEVVTSYLISKVQTGFLKGRFIAENLMELSTVICSAQKNKEEGVIVAVDFQKAYNTLEHKALYSILRAFNIGETFISYIKVCQENAEAAVINNGNRSEFMSIKHGLKQGNLLSCQLFNLAVEVLGRKIQQEDDIEGIEVADTQKKLGQYTDDLWIAMKHKSKCFKTLFRILKNFGIFSGLKVNYDKTEVLRIGSLKYSDAQYTSGLPLVWSDPCPIKILGIQWFADENLTMESNFKETLTKAQNILSVWSKRSLSLIGKILIVNTLIFPLFNYRLAIIRTPTKQQLAAFKAMVVDFLWDGKGAKIAYNTLIKPYNKGGLKLFDLGLRDLALKIKWVQICRADKNSLLAKTMNQDVSPANL